MNDIYNNTEQHTQGIAMNKITSIASAVVLASASMSASAWWGGDDFFGDGFFGFDMSMSAGGSGSSRYHSLYGPYGWGPYAAPYGYGYPYPYGYTAPTATEGTTAPAPTYSQFPGQPDPTTVANWYAEQQKAMAQAMETQRQFAEQVAADQARMAELMRPQVTPVSYDLGRPSLPGYVSERLAEMETLREERMKEAETRREEMMKQIDAQREAALARRPTRPTYEVVPPTPVKKDI